MYRTFSNCIDKFALSPFSAEKRCLCVHACQVSSHIQKHNRQRALSVDTNCSGIARADGAFYITI